ncbi:MAG: AI-2E family transporter [Spirochaetia bacterium]|nr:AI-2E family transporter [Spirochaetia bacterium]
MLKGKLSTIFLGMIFLIAVGFMLSVAKSVFIPMVIAILFSFMLYPLVIALQNIRIPRIIAITLVIIILFGFVYLIVIILYSSINAFSNQYPWYLEQFKDIYKDFSYQLMTRFNISTTDFLLDYNWGKVSRGYLLSFSNSLTKLIGYILIVLFFLIFLFLEFPLFRLKLKKAFPVRTSKKFFIVIGHITREVGKYLSIKLLISAITGFLVWVVLLIIGLDFPLVWGVLAFFLNFIPNIGSIIVVFFISIQAVVQFYPSVGMVMLVTLTMTAIQVTLGNLVEPELQGNKLNLSPVIILFSLLFWGWLWGTVGALLSVPITVTIKIVCQNIEFLRPVSIMMGTGSLRKKPKPKPKRRRKK